jgi:hypothetical protein
MLKTCENCAKDFLTEADPYVVVPTPNGCRYYCSCRIVGHDSVKSLAQVMKWRYENDKMRELLLKFANADYRGNRSNESVDSFLLLKKLDNND